MTALSDPEERELDSTAVAGYLRRNPGFFRQYPELAPALDGPGAATSLVQRQMATLRERNDDLAGRLQELREVASDNDRIFSAARALSLALLDVRSADELDRCLAQHVVGGFRLDHVVCYLAGSLMPALHHLRSVAAGDRPPLPALFDHPAPVCNACRPEEYARLFGERLAGPGSVALVPSRRGPINATLAIGSRDPGRYTPELATDFLAYLGELLARTLVRIGIA